MDTNVKIDCRIKSLSSSRVNPWLEFIEQEVRKEIDSEIKELYPEVEIIKETVTAKSRKLSCNWKVELNQDIDYLNQYYIGKGSPEKFFEKAFEDERRKRNHEV